MGATAVAFAGLLTGHAGADETTAASPAVEGWYPSGVGAVMAPTYPEGTLHVGAIAGQESDRTYLRFELGAPQDAQLTIATLTIPVAADAGTMSPEDADIRACAVPEGFTSGDDPAPEVDCDRSADAAFVAGDTPVFTVDVSTLVVDGHVDLALVPAGGDAWHVGFDSTSREGGSPATVVAAFTPADPSPAVPAPTAGGRSSSRPTFAAPAPPVRPPVLAAPRAPVAVGGAIAGVAGQQVEPTSDTDGGGFRYPGVFALPLALLLVVAIAGDGLTRPVRLRGEA